MRRALAAALAACLLSACATLPPNRVDAAAERRIAVDLASPADGPAIVRFAVDRPVMALHFADDLGGYRQREWRIVEPGFRWVVEPADVRLGTIQGERIERIDGARFAGVGFAVEQRYRALPKNYAPFSPFSDGGLLIYSGFLHACVAFPCSGAGPVAVHIAAPGRQIRVAGVVGSGEAAFVSAEEGTNIYIGNRAPLSSVGGVEAIVDPALPERVASDLSTALPGATAFYATHYGPLSFTPNLFVSLDPRRQPDGTVSTQGGTLPGQIFMHFDGAGAPGRFDGETSWLNWFFAHEVAHMFQRDRTGNRSGDDAAGWIHEGGADAMAALALLDRGDADYVRARVANAASDCMTALASGPLTTATARGAFDAHYACGLIAYLALDADLKVRGGDLHAFNRRFFARVEGGSSWSQATWFAAARDAGASPDTLTELAILVGPDAVAAVSASSRLLRRVAPE